MLFGKGHCFYLLGETSVNLQIKVFHHVSFSFITGLIMLISWVDLDAV